MSKATLKIPVVRRRFRRKEDAIRQLILDAARQEFGRAGYAAATTRSIASHADVSESLVFRYFGSKAALFDLVVFGPFNDLMTRFNETCSVPENQESHAANSRVFISELLQYCWDNRMLLAAFVKSSGDRADESAFSPQAGLENYFAQSQATVDALHRKTRGYADSYTWLAVRLGFATVLSSVLFSNWLFADKQPDVETLTDGLVQMLARVLELEGRSSKIDSAIVS